MLYKYLQKQHAINMLEHGQVRIGSLGAYRAIEASSDAARSDSNEGLSITDVHLTGTKAYAQPRPPIVEQFFGGMLDATNNALVMYNTVVMRSAPMHIFCVADICRIRIAKEFNCDACVEIFDPIGFAEAVTTALKQHGDFKPGKWAPIAYVNSRHRDAYDEGAEVPGCFIKDQRYRSQREFRAVWLPEPGTDVPEYRDVVCSGLDEFCRIKHLDLLN